jgi:hypothetical protein
VEGGDLEVLQWLYANGSPITAETRQAAANLGYVELV